MVHFIFLCTLFLLVPYAIAHHRGNPFVGRKLYVNNNFTTNVRRTLRFSTPAERRALQPLLEVSTAFWLSQRIPETDPSDKGNLNTVLGILTDSASQNPIPITTFVVYNLPNRDCAALASAGKICCLKHANFTCNYEDSRDCNGGLAEYRSAYIDVIAQTIKPFCSIVPMVFIIEPDSLPNMVTNLDNARCSAKGTQESYRQGIKYAVEKLHSACDKAMFYIDAAHGAWLGWDDNAIRFAEEIAALDISNKIRGFATNVANCQILGIACPSLGFCNPGPIHTHPCCQADPCGLTEQFNPGFTELNYVRQLQDKIEAAIPGFKPHFVIDTSRNGVRDARKACSNFCNIRKAGLGILPTVDTAEPDVIDAYLWIKVPGESDGCTEKLRGGALCPRFDAGCASEDSIGTRRGEPRAPEAGGWFKYHIRRMARKANLFG